MTTLLNNLRDTYLSFSENSVIRTIPHNLTKGIITIQNRIQPTLMPIMPNNTRTEGFGNYNSSFTQYLCVISSIIVLIYVCFYFYYN
jgi:hypothetical protein